MASRRRGPEVPGEPCATFAAQEHAHAGQQLVEPFGTTGVRPGETGDPLRKDTALAVGSDAAELPDLPMHHHLPAIRRQVEQASDVLTVTTIREMTAKRTYCASGRAFYDQRNLGGIRSHLLNDHAKSPEEPPHAAKPLSRVSYRGSRLSRKILRSLSRLHPNCGRTSLSPPLTLEPIRAFSTRL